MNFADITGESCLDCGCGTCTCFFFLNKEPHYHMIPGQPSTSVVDMWFGPFWKQPSYEAEHDWLTHLEKHSSLSLSLSGPVQSLSASSLPAPSHLMVFPVPVLGTRNFCSFNPRPLPSPGMEKRVWNTYISSHFDAHVFQSLDFSFLITTKSFCLLNEFQAH